jgi:hypothetical protein
MIDFIEPHQTRDDKVQGYDKVHRTMRIKMPAIREISGVK